MGPIIRILIVDDAPLLRRALKALLGRQSDMEVVGDAEDGERALVNAAALVPDVTVLDVTMQGLSGAETAARMKLARPDAKIVAFSGYDRSERVREMLDAGVDGYVRKNASPDELLRAIRVVAAGGRYLDTEIERCLARESRRARMASGVQIVATPRKPRSRSAAG